MHGAMHTWVLNWCIQTSEFWIRDAIKQDLDLGLILALVHLMWNQRTTISLSRPQTRTTIYSLPPRGTCVHQVTETT